MTMLNTFHLKMVVPCLKFWVFIWYTQAKPPLAVRAERNLSMGGFEIFFYLREDWNQFFQVLLLFSIRKLVLSQNLRED